MKTAMQELIDEMCSINWHLYSFNDKMKVVNVYLEKEKEQMFYWFYGGGSLSAIDDFRKEFEKNYNQTYNQNK
jgi:hypothetical protein